MSKTNLISLREFDFLAVKKTEMFHQVEDVKVQYISQKDFDNIHEFVLENNSKEDSEILNFLIPQYNRKYGKILKAQNFVGVIQTKTGLTVEILPKIAQINEFEETRKIFLKMLRTLKDTPFKQFNNSHLKTSKIHLLEIFIEMFLKEVWNLLKRGIRMHYVVREDNLRFLKGKLDINQHLKQNFFHKERFFVIYDEFLPDIPENRLIKTTLKYLWTVSKSFINQKKIREYLFILEEISESSNVESDFIRIKSNRLLKEYDQILKWCRVFLKKESFTNFSGNTLAFALLFPMEKVFESYITNYFRKKYDYEEFHAQHKKFFLVSKDQTNMFNLRPDIVMFRNGTIDIFDAKWKMLSNDGKQNYGISQSDMYQLFSYAKIFDAKYTNKKSKLFLVYPKPQENISDCISYIYNDSVDGDYTKLDVLFFDIAQDKLICPT